jgi:ABC-2 type transport system ATP-binding protein
MDEAEALCDRIAIVDHGKVAALGTPAELKSSVPGSDTLDLALAHPLPGEALASLRALPGVRALDAGPEGLRVRADGGPALLPRLIDAIRAAGVEVTAASVSRLTLEDVFIQLTGHTLREEAPVARSGPPRRFT